MQQICAYSGAPVCNGCEGAVYKCDPRKNIACTKENCGICQHTHNPQFSQTPIDPQCTRVLENEQKSLNRSIREPMKALSKRMGKCEEAIRTIKREMFAVQFRTALHLDSEKEYEKGTTSFFWVVITSIIASIVTNLLLR